MATGSATSTGSENIIIMDVHAEAKNEPEAYIHRTINDIAATRMVHSADKSEIGRAHV